MIERVMLVVRAAGYGIRVISQRVALTVGILCIAAGTGVVVAFPLWYLAENYTTTYTVLAVTTIAVGLAVGAIRQIVSARRVAGESRERSSALARIAWTIAGAIAAYAAVVAAVSGSYALAAALALSLVLVPAVRMGLRHGARTEDRL